VVASEAVDDGDSLDRLLQGWPGFQQLRPHVLVLGAYLIGLRQHHVISRGRLWGPVPEPPVVAPKVLHRMLMADEAPTPEANQV
jgi:hypothetical protein